MNDFAADAAAIRRTRLRRTPVIEPLLVVNWEPLYPLCMSHCPP
jgi:hypothetical protein